ncbi:uncharacterized protein LOC117174394 [Belonocnema kinseyi]|uniref:uncharacterized protein LOC117174394 n=1 Tax=Belonocnema kinseyi TaxID=2817044 RepID=UPI00143D9EE1|nr:uncharacterized protein LOC117174394 [Belonocnema kinseyi]
MSLTNRKNAVDEHYNSNMTQEEQFRSEFWNKLQNGMRVWVPLHIKNILKLSNLDNASCLQDLDDAAIKELESFAKTIMLKKVKNEPDLTQYYGVFNEEPENFEFVIGDKLILKRMVKFTQATPFEYWTSRTSESYAMPSTQKSDKDPDTDISTEISKVNRLVKKVVNETTPYLSETHRVNLLNGVDTNISIEKDAYDVLQCYKATITCPVCHQNLNFTKSMTKTNYNPRWIISNLKRHFETHFIVQPDNKKITKQTKKKKIQL